MYAEAVKMSEKKNSVASSFAYKFIERISVKFIGLVIGIILARLLDPDVFGLLTIITVFINLAQTFVQSGLGIALVQNRSTTRDDYSTVFYISLAMATVFTVILFVAAPFIADFYDSDQIIWPLRAFSAALFIGAMSSVQVAKLQREMKFNLMMRCNLTATIVSGAAGIAAAYMGAGLWALVIYHLAQMFIASVAMFIVDRWHPELVFSKERAKVLFGFGWKLLVSSLIATLYVDLRALIIGKKYSTEDLAYYNKGQQFPDMIANTIDVSIQSVMLPVMSAEQDNSRKVAEITRKALSLSMFGVLPMMCGLAAVAETLIPLLLTEKWNASIPIMCIFCFSAMAFPIKTTNLSVIKALGRSDMFMRNEMVRRIVGVTILLISVFVFDSVMAIAIGYLINAWIDAFIIICSSKKLIGAGFIKQLSWSWKTAVSGFIMLACVYMMNGLDISRPLLLTIQIITGVVIYVLLSILLKNQSFTTILTKVKEFSAKKTKKVEGE